MSCGVVRRRGSDPPLLWLWCRPSAAALIIPLACELPYAAGVALKRQQQQQQQKKKYGINRYKLLHIKQISNKDLLYNTENNIQHLIITYTYKTEYYIYM